MDKYENETWTKTNEEKKKRKKRETRWTELVGVDEKPN